MNDQGGYVIPRIFQERMLEQLRARPWWWPADKAWPPPPMTRMESLRFRWGMWRSETSQRIRHAIAVRIDYHDHEECW